MFEWIVLGITLAILVFLAIAKPQGLIILLAMATALDISSTWYPSIEMVTKALGMISLARLTTFTLILAGFGRLWRAKYRQRLVETLKTPLTWALLIFIALGFISYTHSMNPGATLVEGARLMILFLAYLSVSIIGDAQMAKSPLWAVFFMGIILAPLALYQGYSGNFLWQEHLAQVEAVPRVNTTFVDPNIFARYVILALVANLIFYVTAQERWQKIIYIMTLLLLLAELATTFSRGGFLTLAVAVIVFVLFFPQKKFLFPIGLLGLGGVAALILKPAILERLLTMKEGLAAFDKVRSYLIEAGIAMYKDHTLYGIGLGSFQKALRSTYYSYYKLPGEGATLSHTSVITIAAELGTLGLLALLGILVTLVFLLTNIYYLGRKHFNVGIAYFLWIITIFISSQAEGRFFEDPMLWLSMGMLVALSKTAFEQEMTRVPKSFPIR